MKNIINEKIKFMKKIIILIFIFYTLFQQYSYAKCNYSKTTTFNTAIINNVLNLSDEQIELHSLDLKTFKKCLTYDQKVKYNTIKKLEKKEQKNSKKKKDYYKSNPQMRPFGNLPKCPTVK